MSNSIFLPTNNIETETEKPNPGDQICFSYYSLMDTSTYDDDDDHDQDQDLQLLDCIADHLHNHPDDPISPTLATTNPSSQSYHPLVERSTHPPLAASYSFNTNKPPANIKCERGLKMDHVAGRRIAFRTKSVTEIMDDGFKWRKYGRKMVKSSPNPRNYYKCSNEGCKVKKRVERDGDDSSYVITTYEGIHNHESPSFVCFNEMPRMEFNS